MSNTFHVVTIGYARQALVQGSREYTRMAACAAALGSMHVVVFTNHNEPEEHVEIHDGNFHVYPTQSRHKLLMPFDAIRIACRIIRSAAVRWVVSSQDPFETSVIGRCIARRCKVPHQIQLHSDFYRNAGWLAESRLNPLRRRIGLYYLKRADKVRVVAPGIKESLVTRGIAAEKIAVLPVFVYLDAFNAVGKARLSEPMRTPKRVVFVGRFAPEKNIPFLLRAFAEVPDATLILVGSGPETETIESGIAALGLEERVEIVSWTSDVPAVLRDADVFVLPSLYEGWPLVVLEALAAGMPVVASDVGSIADMFVDGESGYLFPLNDEAALTARLTDVLSLSSVQYGDMATCAHKTAAQYHMSVEDYAVAWADTFACEVCTT